MQCVARERDGGDKVFSFQVPPKRNPTPTSGLAGFKHKKQKVIQVGTLRTLENVDLYANRE